MGRIEQLRTKIEDAKERGEDVREIEIELRRLVRDRSSVERAIDRRIPRG